ncbi:pilus assembly protein PilM [Halobacillus litoralis]|uniref:type IV pilus biogenesis protein PilM n=1 Tax=Halobacillus litoralis TaxID=45668 RepID=UPI001CD6898E|nr:pilus assembly protein PilM [Halobacillus litoralis]MCA0969929.1 pilus assembly protein PilM [Halobacillus litoralis]
MFGWKKDRRVHIVIKDHTLRYIVSPPNDPARIESYGEEFLPGDMVQDGRVQNLRRFEMVLEDIVSKHRLKNLPLYFCVPDSSVILRHISVPSDIEDEAIKGYLYQQLGESLHLPFEQPVFDFVKLSDDKREKEIFLVAYPQEKIAEMEESLSVAQFKPKSADLSSLSVYRVYEKLTFTTEGEHLLLVEWNVDGISVTAFHEGVPQFSRQMKTTLSKQDWKMFTADGESHLHWTGDLQDMEAYVTDQLGELSRILNFYQFSVTKGQAAITRIILSGDWAYFEDLQNRLSQRVDIPVDTISLELLHLSLPDRYTDAVGLIYKN